MTSTSRPPAGCEGVPDTPPGSEMTCTPVLGCKVRCLSGRRAPNGKGSYEVKCRRPGVWKERYGDIPDPWVGCAPERGEDEAAQPTRLLLTAAEFKTADVSGAGMSYLTGGQFRMRLTSSSGEECSSGRLDNDDDNWERGQVWG